MVKSVNLKSKYLVFQNIGSAIFAIASFFGVQGAAMAQSSVSIYGLISAGVGYTSNSGGRNLVSVINGPEQLPRFGFKGREDLGGGTSAIFTLENGFSITNGTLGQGNRMFGRQAWVGLANQRWGTFTVGRQYDDMSQTLYWSESAVLFSAFGTRIGDTDNIFNTLRFNNSVKYKSADYNGLSLSGTYAFSNATEFSNNSGFSFGVSYVHGPLKLGLAMAQYNRPASASNASAAVDSSSYGYSSPFTMSLNGSSVQVQRSIALGATYDFGFLAATLGYSNVLFDYIDSTGLRVQNAELTLTHQITPAWLVGAAYIYTVGDYSSNPQVHYNQLNIGTVYSLSKRTDLFLVGIGQWAGGAAKYAQIYSTTASATRNQFSVTSGIRVKF